MHFVSLSVSFPICRATHGFGDRSEKRVGRIWKWVLTLTCSMGLQGYQTSHCVNPHLWDTPLLTHKLTSLLLLLCNKDLMPACLLALRSHGYRDWGDGGHSQLCLLHKHKLKCVSCILAFISLLWICWLFCTVRIVPSLQIAERLEVQMRKCMLNCFQSLKN